MSQNKKPTNKIPTIATIGGVLIAIILILSTLWTGQVARKDTDTAVRNVSLLYLNELAGRREQVIESNLNNRIRDLNAAISVLTPEDLSDIEHLQNYQMRIKKLYNLDKFAFVDTDGLIYTSTEIQNNIEDYDFDYLNISEAEISILNLDTPQKKVIIATPVSLNLGDARLVVCFMEIDMQDMLTGVSMDSTPEDSTFCNLYTTEGIALSDTILGGLAVEDNLLEALENADFEDGYSMDSFLDSFQNSRKGEVSFTYNGIKETLYYTPINGTDWLLTYLVRESLISAQFEEISQSIITRSVVQSAITILAVLIVFVIITIETKKNTEYRLNIEKNEAELKVKNDEIQHRIHLQEQLENQSRALSDALNAAEEANKAKTVFLSNMSHEIRTPMNAIIGLDNIALNDPETPEKTKEYLTKIGASADHLLDLINDILDMSRIESGKIVLNNEKFSLFKLLESINTMFYGQCEENRIRYNCTIGKEIDEYYIGDNMKIRQILINILGNAVKFTKEGGYVELSVIKKASYGNKTTLEFTVKDNGIGMGREFIPHIFDAFAQEDNSNTNKYGSSGLGLAITKNIVELMNGTIDVESEKGKGSAFTVTLTLDNAESVETDNNKDELSDSGSSTKSSKTPDYSSLKDRRVLLAEDVAINTEIMMMILDSQGIKAEHAENGKVAFKMYTEHPEGYYDAILMDIRMPEMDGLEATAAIRNLDRKDSKTIPIIALSANAFDEDVQRSLQAGLNAHLTKPVQPEDLFNTLINLI